jgi:hypothetical protein
MVICVQVKVFCIIDRSHGGVVVALECRNSEKALLRGYRECAIVFSGIE